MLDFEMTFPAGFLWGTATAAHQVEGHAPPNNWTAWEDELGRIHRDDRAGAACDWWGGRYLEDLDRAAALNNNAHRFSIEWSRIEPERGEFDSAAIDHYHAMFDELRARGLEPFVTLHHFTNPQWIEALGGWTSEETVRRFARFARLIADEFGGEARYWCVINEPMVYATQSYLLGRFPPGERSLSRALLVAENLLRGHAAAYASIKERQPDAQVGIAKHQISLIPRRPALIHTPARNAIRQFFNRAWIDALMTGTLRFSSRAVEIPEARDTLDWIGLNYYYRFAAGFNPLAPKQLFLQQSRPRSGILGPEGVGEIWPEGLFDEIKWLCRRTGKPLYITENGVPDADDSLRPAHLIRSVRNVWDALNQNLPVRGYFYWTLVDNFEWAEGYDPRFRFGLYACDRQTQARAPKRSADLYRAICGANALTGAMVSEFAPDLIGTCFPDIEVHAEVELPRRA